VCSFYLRRDGSRPAARPPVLRKLDGGGKREERRVMIRLMGLNKATDADGRKCKGNAGYGQEKERDPAGGVR